MFGVGQPSSCSQIDFEEKRGNDKFAFWNTSEDVDDMLTTAYDEPVRVSQAIPKYRNLTLSDWGDEGLYRASFTRRICTCTGRTAVRANSDGGRERAKRKARGAYYHCRRSCIPA